MDRAIKAVALRLRKRAWALLILAAQVLIVACAISTAFSERYLANIIAIAAFCLLAVGVLLQLLLDGTISECKEARTPED